jgi:CRISPR/Cas system-associated endoribonuclease Cas2
MVLAIYDVATHGARKKAERVLRRMNFVFLFGNARWVNRPVDIGTLTRRLRSALRGEAFRILIVQLPSRSVELARWLHGSTPRRPQ